MPPLNELDRRAVLRLLAAGAVAGLGACDRPDQPIYPATNHPEGEKPGVLRRYATTLTLAGYGRGVTARVVDGRPIKLEGTPGHPASLGATDVFSEAAILDLYDPQRIKAPTADGIVGAWPILERSLIARLAGSDGTGLRLLTGRITSPTVLTRIAELQRGFPAMRHYRAEPIDDDAEREGAQLAWGRPLTMRPRLAEADTIVALDADPLGPGPDQVAWARAWSTRKRADAAPPRLYVFEPSMTLTGACSDRRVAAGPQGIVDVLLALASGFGAGTPPPLPPTTAAAVEAARNDLVNGRGIVLVGRGQPPEAHALAAWINAQLAAPVDWIEPVDPHPLGHGEGLATLSAEMHAGSVSTLLMLDVNPVGTAPPALDFAGGLRRVPFSIAASRFPNETLGGATWFAALSDPLECWGDARAPDGTASLAQPLVRPFHDTRSPLGLLDLLDPASARPDHQRVREQWRGRAPEDFERWWRDTLVAGVIAGSAARPVSVGTPKLVLPRRAEATGLQLTLIPSPTLWDGRFASNAWAQECPDPLTKEVWGASVRLHPADAAAMAVADGDSLALGHGQFAAARIVAGQAEGVATLPLGHGRVRAGPIAGTVGANGFAFRPRAGGWSVPLDAHLGGGQKEVTTTQELFQVEGETAKLFPVVASGEALPPPKRQPSLLPARPPKSTAPQQWGMVIDTDVCIGCNACVVACQAENNVPAIGPDEMANNRDMHWLRIDRYNRGDAGDPQPGFQPVPCMQCEAAPCEPVCPVEASVHDDQGLNVQVYNRCISTRTCQANCPYKVRHFNFLAYAENGVWKDFDQATTTAQRNPEVTVRARGVMEKCTYCVQRITAAKIEADATGEPIGAVTTACQDACPTRAIQFGNLEDTASVVSGLRSDPRHYALLEELGTRPRTTYLAKVRNL